MSDIVLAKSNNLPASIEPQRNINETAVSVRETETIRAKVISAKNFPRNELQAEAKILESCKRPGLARLALYRYPRGGAQVEGPSIRLAEAIAQRWGNLDFGWKVLELDEEYATLEAYCRDLETMTDRNTQWKVKLSRTTKQGTYKLTDPRDIYEVQANDASRRLRACILAIIPFDIVESCVNQCKLTLIEGDKSVPFVDRLKQMLSKFKELGVDQEMIERKFGHSVDLLNPEEMLELRGIFGALTDKIGKREDYFEFSESQNPIKPSLADKIK
jgi:hypothetical protein